MSAARDRLYVIESDVKFMGGSITWDGSQWVSTSTSAAVDVTSLPYVIPPRLSVYYRSTIGQ